jgi:hypothetical protein
MDSEKGPTDRSDRVILSLVPALASQATYVISCHGMTVSTASL